MTDTLTVTGVELYAFVNEMRDRAGGAWKPGAVAKPVWYACRITTDQGITGEHFTWAGKRGKSAWGAAASLVGRDALGREEIYRDLKPRPCVAILDNTLWDIAGKRYSQPVYRLLGGSKMRLPVYASTTMGDAHSGGLNSPQAYADFAEECLAMGIRGYKAHPWRDGDVKRHVALVHALGRRVGDRMDLMLDPACCYATFMDALKVGRACDEEDFCWYEDPVEYGADAHTVYRKLAEELKTPLLQGEFTQGLENKMSFFTAGATDIIRGDAEADGITATMKLAHAAEAMGVNIEMHGWTPASAHCVAAIGNTNYLELSLVHPRLRYEPCPFISEGFHPLGLDDVGKDGCVPMWQGPGLGVPINWDYVRSHALDSVVFK